MKKHLFLFVSVLLMAISAFAIPASPKPVTLKLEDGAEVTYYVKGDEKVHWKQSPDGYTLLFNDAKQLVYAEKDADGDLIPSNILYKGESRDKNTVSERSRINALQKDLRFSKAQIAMRKQIWDIGKEASEPNRAVTPVTGTKNVLCILANFSNKTMTKTQAQFNSMMNDIGYTTSGNRGSVKDFYLENSYGALTVNVTVVGPVTLSKTCAYYSPADGSKYKEFAQECAQLADAAGVNFATYAVNNSVPTYHIIFAGYGDEYLDNAQQIWSHQWSYTPITIDGVSVGSRYSCSPELSGGSGSTMSTVGVVCHEMCHAFGAPDYYDTDDATGGSFQGTGYWDLMASGSYNGTSTNGGDCPAHINMYQKYLFGWVTPIELTNPITIQNMPNSAQNAVAYFYKASTNNEVYMIENRQKVGFDSYVPGKGMLIWHAHNTAYGGNASNAGHPQQLYPVCAAATTALPTATASTYGTAAQINGTACTFPGTGTKTSFTSTSTPRTFYWNNTTATTITGKDITEITENTSGKTVSFKYRGGSVAATNDAELYAIITPVSSQNMTSTETVTITLKNNGTANLTSVPLRLVVDGGLVATETWSGTLANNATTNYTFAAKANLATAGNHSIKAIANLTTDEYRANDTMAVTVTNTVCAPVAAVGFSEGFEGAIFPPDCWSLIDADGDGHNWESGATGLRVHSGTKSANSASYDNTSLSALTPQNYLITPPLSIPAGGATLKFWRAGQDVTWNKEKYTVKVSTTNNSSTSAFTTIFTETLTDSAWAQKSVSLNAYAGQNIYVAFVHEDCTDMFWLNIDDISIETPPTTPGCGTVAMANWEYGTMASSPVPASTCQGTAGVTYSYSGRNTTTYGPLVTRPSAVGEYTVTATFPQNSTYFEHTATANFEITPSTAEPFICDGVDTELDNFTPYTDSTTLYTVGGGGYVSGPNTYGDLGKFEKITFPTDGTVTDLYFAVRHAATTTGSVTLKVYASDQSTSLFSETMLTSSIPSNEYSLFTLPVPIEVTTGQSIYVGFEWASSYPLTDSFAIWQVTSSTIPAGTAYEIYSGTWYAFSDSWNFSNTSLCVGVYYCAPVRETIVLWNFPSAANAALSNGGITANNGTRSISKVGGTTTLSYDTRTGNTYAVRTSAWNAGANSYHWLVSFTTTGYKSLTLSFDAMSATQGGNRPPSAFKVQYSLNGSTWVDVGYSYTLSTSGTWVPASNVILPAACNNKEIIYLRWLMTSNTGIGGTVQANGRNSMDNIYIIGSPIPDGCGTVTLADWIYGSPNTPQLTSSCQGTAGVTITYLGRGGTVYAESTTVPTNVGTYTVKVVFPATANYTTYTATNDFEITKKNITKPTLVTNSFVYDGTQKTVALTPTNAAYSLGGTYFATIVGNYNASAILADIDNTQWADGSTTSVTLPWAITIANGCGTVTLADWIYSNAPNTPQLASICQGTAGVTITYLGRGETTYAESTTVPTNVGTYTVKAVFPATVNYTAYTASDDFEITKKSIAKPTLVANSFVYDGTPKTVALTPTNAAYSLGGTYFATIVGNYNASAILADIANTQWADGSTTGVTLSWAITIADGCGTVTLADWIYGNAPNIPQLASTCQGTAGVTITYLGRGGTVYAESTTVPTNVGTYTVKAVFPATVNYTAYTASDDFEITKKSIAKPTLVANSFVYDGTPKTVALTPTNAAYSLGGTYFATIVGNYNASAILADIANTQWADGSTTGVTLSWAITIADGCGTVTLADWVYAATPATPQLASSCQGTAGVTITYLGRGGTVYAESTTVPTNVGTYTVKAVFPATANYTAYTATDDFEITKKSITKPTLVTNSFVYDGTQKTVALTPTNAAYSLGGVYFATNVGNYNASAILADIDNTQWADGSTTSVTLPWAITIADGCGTVTLADWIYSNAPSTPQLASICQGTAGVTISYLGRGATTYAESTTVPTNVGTYTVKAVFPATANYTTYTASDDFEITKKNITKPTLVTNSFVYDGSQKTVVLTPTNAAYSLGGVYFATIVGNYNASATLEDIANTQWSDGSNTSVTLPWAITIANGCGTVTLEDWVYAATPATPQLASICQGTAGVSITYLGRGETVYAESTTVPTNVGTYTVKAVFPATANYKQYTVTADFAITKKSIAKPTLVQNLFQHDGNPKTVALTVTNAAYTFGGTISATEIDNYTATVTLNDLANTQWADGSTTVLNLHWAIVWTISQDEGCGSVTLADWAYGAAPGIPVITSICNGIDNAIVTYLGREDTEYEESAFAPTLVGTYTIKVVFPETQDYYEFTTSYDFAITKKNITKPTLVANSFVYDGTQKTVALTPTNAAYSLGGTYFATIVGNYNASAILADIDNTQWADGSNTSVTLPWAITIADGCGTVALADWIYGSPNTPQLASSCQGTAGVTISYLGRGETVYVESTTVPTNVGTYTVKAVFPASANYTAYTATNDFEITKKNITKPTLVTNSFVYDGTQKTVALTPTNAAYSLGGVYFCYHRRQLQRKCHLGRH